MERDQSFFEVGSRLSPEQAIPPKSRWSTRIRPGTLPHAVKSRLAPSGPLTTASMTWRDSNPRDSGHWCPGARVERIPFVTAEQGGDG